MAKLHLAKQAAPKVVVFRCPGCQESHSIPVQAPESAEYAKSRHVWGWNGSIELPTFTPSVLVRSGHYADGGKSGVCWCTYNAEHPNDPAPFTCSVCHSWVKDGQIQFLSDCTHHLAGQTVELPDWEA